MNKTLQAIRDAIAKRGWTPEEPTMEALHNALREDGFCGAPVRPCLLCLSIWQLVRPVGEDGQFLVVAIDRDAEIVEIMEPPFQDGKPTRTLTLDRIALVEDEIDG
jgi:hypothetical protein